MPFRAQNSNKGTFGKVLNFAGSKNYIGASYLSALSVLKSGAGFVALATEPEVIKIVSSMLPEAVYYTRNEALKYKNQFTVVIIGCGLGLSNKSKNIFKKVVRLYNKSEIPFIIDADGLNILSEIKKINLPKNTVITPHPMEASRLLGLKLGDVLNNLEECAKELSRKYSCVTVLKTHRTIIYDNKTGEVFVNQHGNSALAKAGSGDVLTGIIGGLTAQKMPLFEACKLGVYLHSRAGELASENLTEYSVLASDLPNYLHLAISELI